MKSIKSRGAAALIVLAAVWTLLCPGCSAADAASEEEQAKAAVETFLGNYEAAAMLDQAADLTPCTVSDSALAWEAADQAFTISGESATLAELRENIVYLSRKAACWAGMRRMQDIRREDLRLTYTYKSLVLGENTGRASLTETAEFFYTDSERPSVFEMSWRVTLVKVAGRWVVADATDWSSFDGTYKGKGPLDVPAVLAEFAEGLAREDCVVSYPLEESPDPAGNILYRGSDAAAYAYTYARPDADPDREGFYNPLFKAYAGNGGDCMNFTSQCLWAGFGGSETAEAVDGHAAPMDTAGLSTWYGRTAAEGTRDEDIYSWISCSSFRKYLMDGETRTNLLEEPGLYATVLDLGTGGVSGVTPEELIGAAAHVNGSGGLYSHAVILTDAKGLSRGEIWFCSHTADITNIKLGDYYTGPLKIYIPRYMRTDASPEGTARPERLGPVSVGDVKTIGFGTEGDAYRRLTLSITAPGGTEPEREVTTDGTACSTEYEFTTEGLYRVDCVAEPFAVGERSSATYYIRCMTSASRVLEAPKEEPAEPPEQTPEEKAAEDRKIRQSLLA